MLRSMTGYGIGKAEHNGHVITVEIRSVNNRFFDVNFRLPRALVRYESELREIIRKRLQRGRISFFINEEWSEDSTLEKKVDKGKARAYYKALADLNTDLGLKDDVKLGHLLSMNDIFQSLDDEEYVAEFWNLTKDATEKALDEVVKVSLAEGKNLTNDLSKRIKSIEIEKDRIAVLAKDQVSEYQSKLFERLEEIISDERIDQSRIEAEIALTADRLDITEEIVRLSSHIDLFKSSLKDKKSSGKTLNFILQEMGREVNTIGSKSWMVEISHAALSIKEVLEQVREQVQNIE